MVTVTSVCSMFNAVCIKFVEIINFNVVDKIVCIKFVEIVNFNVVK